MEATEACFDAGIDVGLHCNGDPDEMRGVAEGAPALAGAALRRAEAALARLPAGPDARNAGRPVRSGSTSSASIRSP